VAANRTSRRHCIFFAVGIAVGVTLGSTGALARKTSVAATSPKELVADLYREFAWDSLFASDPHLTGPQWQPLVLEPAGMLQHYFEPQLAQLFVDDRKCIARTHGICNLDFDPIFDTQDNSGATELTVSPDVQGKVTVSIAYPRGREPVTIIYTVKRTPAGLRIFDIEYPTGPSLRTLLSRRSDR